MLGRLIQTAANYSKSNASLESATEEAHTRNLLYGQSQHVYSLAQSPPSSPFAGPNFRPGSFDDRGGLEFEEKDLRLIIAQDAYGAEEKPTVLFDSNATVSVAQTSPSHIRHGSATQAGPRAPLPTDWRPGASNIQVKTAVDVPFRNRSSTISNAPSAWTRQFKETSTREEALLECMFGVTSSTKATSTIKMHVIPGKPKPALPGSGRAGMVNEPGDSSSRRAPLARSRTSNMSPRGQLPSLSTLDTDSASHDAILITRLFHISLPESIGTQDNNNASSPTDTNFTNGNLVTTPTDIAYSKKPKLVERKVPAFAIGLVLQLPHSPANRPTSTRPASRAAHGHSLSSISGSFGSDMQNSWTFLNAIPESLSSRGPISDTDKRIDAIVNNWEIILRAISALEHEATNVIYEQLDKTLRQVSGPSQKIPKEKSMQRINQRVISITNPAVIAERVSLVRASRHVIPRICYALRVPRVVTGLGFAAGHWSDEARTLHRICGRRQQNFFLFTLLTAFLGNHTQWLQRLAPDWYRRQFRATHKTHSENHILSSRTVIVSDQRTIARRLIFVLASFLPSSSGLDGLQKIGEDFTLSGRLSTSSPSQVTRIESLRRTANRKLRDHRLQSTSNDKSLLSTSASSIDSITPYLSKDRPRRYLVRKDSDTLSVRGLQSMSQPDADTKKAAAGTTLAISPNPTMPVAYFSTKSDSYFPEGVLAETHESVASADLAKILRRSSSSAGNSSNVSSRWGSLMSGISDLWSQKHLHSNDNGTHTPQTPIDSYNNRPLQQTRTPTMEVVSSDTTKDITPETELPNVEGSPAVENSQIATKRSSILDPQNSLVTLSSAPKLKVDDKDGVIDVDLDWPMFPTFSQESSLFSPVKKAHRPSGASLGDGNESIRSLRSIPTLSPKAPVAEETSVAGFLRRHHQDFAVHAVRPYADLNDDIRRSMLMEPSPVMDNIAQPSPAGSSDWSEICTTLIADVRTFSVRRIVLRRKLRHEPQPTYDSADRHANESPSKTTRRTTSNFEEEFVEEEVKDFDVMLADAIERVLNLAEALQPQGSQSPHQGHVRTLSNGTTHSSKAPIASSFDSNMLSITQEYAKQDCRQVIIGALEEIVKDVNNDLDKLQKGRAIQEARTNSIFSPHKEVKQDNLLREGVKKWLHEVDEMRPAV